MRKLAGRPRLQAVSWLAPECFRGDGLSKHSDVYAFGILMWELYTGQVGMQKLGAFTASHLGVNAFLSAPPAHNPHSSSWLWSAMICMSPAEHDSG
jgi:serine/threonine protein kinase